MARMASMVFTSRLGNLYMINCGLLFAHEIDSAFWQEWVLFGIPGGIQVFVVVSDSKQAGAGYLDGGVQCGF
jgi:hypothetical protein